MSIVFLKIHTKFIKRAARNLLAAPIGSGSVCDARTLGEDVSFIRPDHIQVYTGIDVCGVVIEDTQRLCSVRCATNILVVNMDNENWTIRSEVAHPGEAEIGEDDAVKSFGHMLHSVEEL